MKITYLGHSAFKIVTEEGLILLIDPFISNNPACMIPVEQLRPDLILVTHGHQDHFGDTLEIANNSGAKVISNHEIAGFIQKQGFEAEGMNIGGTIKINDLIEITMVSATHTSSFDFMDELEYAGESTGFIITLENGKKIYHAGDTGLFGDMKTVIGDIYKPDISLLPIGDKYTMGPELAAIAAKWLQSRLIIPMHYNTYPQIEQNTDLFTQLVSDESIGTITWALNPGESYSEE